MRFIHAADIHLGYQQYNLPERYRDFSEAYLGMVEHAVAGRVDFVLIAGDLFHQANTDARTLSVAISGLERLRRADIPVVAIEGNHDAQHQ
ncbi:MAG: DNA repair exonuclease, partial [Chloroflexota bacterium]